MNHSEKINKTTCAVIPFYNEEENISKIISSVAKYVDLIIVVNDGSTDKSTEKIIPTDKLILINHKTNLGKGKALKTGFLKSIELKTEITLTLDADLQHAPEYIPKFISELKTYDAIIGNRLHNKKGMPAHRRLSNFLTSKLLGIKTGQKILDSQSGYRAFRTEILKDILPEYQGFEAESEMIVKLLKNNYKLGFVNIPTIYGNEKSKMRGWQTIKGFVKVLLDQ